MADLSTIKLPNNNSYTLKDSNAIGSINFSGHILTTVKRGGGTAQIDIGTFDTISVTDLSVGDLVVTGPASFTNGLYGNLNGNATTANSATKATQDESGNNIKASYASSFSISDHTITLKNKNGTSLGTVTVPDNNTTYTFANGTNSFTVTPSGGSAQTVTVTPSITNNVISNGTTTSGYLAKFSAANTVTNGPQLGSSTATYLRNDGTWQTPYTFTSGTNGFTVTPAGGTAQTVTVTPSITNNITGSGTNNYIAKFSGANTLTNGPAIGSSTTTYLRNDGTWATPTNTWNAMTGATQSANGTVGYVNAVPPADGYNSKFLRADSTWAKVQWDNVAPLQEKTFENVTVSGNSDPAGWLYFFKAPSTKGYYDQWHLTYRITALMAGDDDGKQTSIVHIDGVRNTYMSYYTWNSINNTNRRPIYGHPWYPVKQAGLTGKYGPVFGIRFQTSYYPENTTYKRTIKIEILESDGCEVTFFDSPLLYANVYGTGSTNFEGRQAFDGTTNGITISGDRNNYNYIQHTYTHLTAGTNGMKQYSLVMQDSTGKWQSFTTDYGAGTSKTKNTAGFVLGNMYYMATSGNHAADQVNGNSIVYSIYPVINFQYSTNCGTTLTANKPVYIVGTVNTDGLFYLDSPWWTQTEPTTADGKIYIYIGVSYDTYQIDFHGYRGAFYHDGTRFRPYIYANATQSNYGFMSSTDKTKLDSYVLRSTTKLANDSAAGTETAGKIYPVVFDKSGYLSVNVPWVNTTALASMTGTLGVGNGGTGQTSFTNNAIITGAGSNTALKSVATANGAAYATSANGALTFGTLPVAQGGTGKTSGIDAANYFLNQLSTGSSTPVDADYYISQYVNGGTTTTTYHRRPMSALWSYISGKMSKAIDGVTFDGSAAITHYGTCATAAATAEKEVSCTSWNLVTGAIIWVKFTVTNTAAVANLKLNVNAKGAKAIKYRGANLPSVGILTANRLYGFVYDGTNFELIGDLDTDANTTYSAGTGLSLSGNQFSLATSGATAGSYGMAAATTLQQGSTVNIPYITVDTYGRITAISNKVLTLDIDELDTLTVDSLTVGNVLATGAARFTNGLFGNLTGNVTGNADTATSAGTATTATKFASAQSVTLTGDTTGTASSQAGWSIATTTKLFTGTGESSPALTTSPGTGKIRYSYNVNNGTTGLFNNSNNANSIITLNRHQGDHHTQIGFSSDHNIYFRSMSAALDTTTAWKTILDSNNYTTYTVKKDGTGATGTWPMGITGNAGTATKFSSARSIALTGDVTGSASADGSSGWSIATTVGDDSHSHTAATMYKPIQTKNYADVTVTGNSDPAGWIYFGTMDPTNNDYKQHSYVKFRIMSNIPYFANNQGYEESIVEIMMFNSSLLWYRTENNVSNGSYRPLYNYIIYRANPAGVTSGYGHLLGVRLQSSYEPANASYKRTFTIEVLETRNCSVSFFDNMVLYANAPGTGSTNYNGRSELDGTTNGIKHSGDANDANYVNRIYYTSRVAKAALYRYQICLSTIDNKLLPVNSVDNSVATNKTLTTEAFNPFGEIAFYNTTTTIAAGGNVGNNTLHRQALADLRYSFNCGTGNLTARQPLYLVASPQSDGTAKLYSTPLSQSLPSTDNGLIYIYLGQVYEDGSPYRTELTLYHPVYWYKDGGIRQYVHIATKATQDASGNTITTTYATKAKALQLYTRSEIGTSPNYDNPGVNGLFEIRNSSEVTGESGTKPFNGYGPFLTMKSENVMLQFAGVNSGGLFWRGKQAASVTMDGTSWLKILDSSSYSSYAVPKSGGAFTGAVTGTSFAASGYLACNSGNSGTAGGIAFYSTVPTDYGIAMRNTSNGGKHGYVQGDWAIYSYMKGSDNTNKLTRGWILKNVNDNVGVASVSGAGHAVFTGSVTVGGNVTNTSGCRLVVNETTQSLDFVWV